MTDVTKAKHEYIYFFKEKKLHKPMATKRTVNQEMKTNERKGKTQNELGTSQRNRRI